VTSAALVRDDVTHLHLFLLFSFPLSFPHVAKKKKKKKKNARDKCLTFSARSDLNAWLWGAWESLAGRARRATASQLRPDLVGCYGTKCSLFANSPLWHPPRLKKPIHRISPLLEKGQPRTMNNSASLYLSQREIMLPASVIHFWKNNFISFSRSSRS